MQGLKPPVLALPMCATTKVVPCYKAHEFNILRGAFSSRAGTNLDAFALGKLGRVGQLSLRAKKTAAAGGLQQPLRAAGAADLGGPGCRRLFGSRWTGPAEVCGFPGLKIETGGTRPPAVGPIARYPLA